MCKTHQFLIHCILLCFLASTGCKNHTENVEKEEVAEPEWKWEEWDQQAAYTVDTFFQRKLRNIWFNGVYLLRDSNKIHCGVVGKADWKTGDSLTREHTFQLGSVSKVLTAVAILKLYEQGKLDLKDPVEKYIHGFPYDGITIDLLLSHRSGLGNYMYITDSLWPDLYDPISNDDVLSVLAEHRPMTYYRPNQAFDYCNTNYMLLASIIDCASGKPFPQYMREEIFEPAGMNSARIFRMLNNDELVKPAKGHNAYREHKNISYLDGVYGDKGVYASIDDMLAFEMALRNNILISDSILRLAWIPRSKKRITKANYGYGFRITDHDANLNAIFHKGWWRGYKAYFMLYPDSDQAAIVLTNCTRGGYLNERELFKLFPKKSI